MINNYKYYVWFLGRGSICIWNQNEQTTLNNINATTNRCDIVHFDSRCKLNLVLKPTLIRYLSRVYTNKTNPYV